MITPIQTTPPVNPPLDAEAAAEEFRSGKIIAYRTGSYYAVLSLMNTFYGFVTIGKACTPKFVSTRSVESITRAVSPARKLFVLDSVTELESLPLSHTND